MSYDKVEELPTGGGAFSLKAILCLLYTVACTIAERTQLPDDAHTRAGVVISAVVVAPLMVCAMIYALWWRRADEFQKMIEYRACALGALGGVAFLVLMKLASYFLPEISHVPVLGIIGMVLVYWINNSHRLNVLALKP